MSRREAVGYVLLGSDPSDRRVEVVSNTAAGLAALERDETFEASVAAIS